MSGLEKRGSKHTAGKFIHTACMLAAAMVMLAFAPGPARAQPAAAHLSISIEPAEPLVGDAVTARVFLDANLQPVSVAGVFISFDPSRLRFENGSVNTAVFNNGLFTSPPNSIEPGVVSFSAGSTSPKTGNGILVATLNFTAISNGQTSLNFLTQPPRETTVESATFQALPLTVEGVTFAIASGRTVNLYLEPSAQTTDIGGEVEMNVMLNTNGLPVRYLDAFVAYDPAFVDFAGGELDISKFNFLILNTPPQVLTTGTVVLRGASTVDLVGDAIHVATLRFSGVNNGAALLRFRNQPPTRSIARNPEYAEYMTATQGGVIGVGLTEFSHVSFAPGFQNAANGDQIEVEVRLEPVGTPARLMEVFLSFDNLRLSFVGGTLNADVFDDQIVSTNPSLAGPGVVSFLAASTDDIVDTNTLVAKLTFNTLGTGDAPLTYLNQIGQVTQVLDASSDPIETILQNGLVRISPVEVTRLYIDPRIRLVEQGETALLDLRLDARGNPQNVSAFLEFNTSRLGFTSGTLNLAVFDNAGLNQTPVESGGIVTLSAGATAPITGDVLVATLAFDALTSGLADVSLLLDPPNRTVVQTGAFSDVPFNTADGVIAVVGAPPVVQSIVRLDPGPATDVATVRFQIQFSVNVTGFDESDLAFAPAPYLDGIAILSLTGSDSTREVEVGTGTGFGDLRLIVIDDDSVVDINGLPLGGLGQGNGDFTTGEFYSIRQPVDHWRLY